MAHTWSATLIAAAGLVAVLASVRRGARWWTAAPHSSRRSPGDPSGLAHGRLAAPLGPGSASLEQRLVLGMTLDDPDPIPVFPGDYDEQLARRFAALSAATYCDKGKLLNWTCGPCRDSHDLFPVAPGSVRVIDAARHNATRIVVGKLLGQEGCFMAFRGSDNLQNWISDFQFFEVNPRTFEECDGCKVHWGFYQIWLDVRELVVQALSEAGCANATESKDNLLYITGHSLGAALTHMAMFTLHNANWNIAKTYSFEAPRVGNRDFSEAFAERFSRKFPVFRITHHEDPVVHLPPTAFGYRHVQTEVYYNRTGGYRICEDSEDLLCADQYWDVPGMVLLHRGDHCGTPLLPSGSFCSAQQC